MPSNQTSKTSVNVSVTDITLPSHAPPSSPQTPKYKLLGNTFHWVNTPRPARVLIVKRPGDDTNSQFNQVIEFLSRKPNVQIYVELNSKDALLSKSDFSKDSSRDSTITIIDTSKIGSRETWDALQSIHLVITLGGDGTILYAASLFQSKNTFCPPILPFALGSLGFLTPISFDMYKEAISRTLGFGRERSATIEITETMEKLKMKEMGQTIDEDDIFDGKSGKKKAENPENDDLSINEDSENRLEPIMRAHSKIQESTLFSQTENIFVTKRTRLFAKVQNSKKHQKCNSGEINSSDSLNSLQSVVENECLSENKRFALNEVVIDRGPNHGMVHLELYINDILIEDIRGDGLIISTPTGSTGYNMSAGGSLVHPSTVAVLITPICPHSLSIRPIVIPPGVKLTIKVADDNRTDPWISFDGRDAHSLQKCQQVSIYLPTKVEEQPGYIVPCICLRDPVDDWFSGLSSCLKWNISRITQKDLDLDEN